MNPWEVEQSGQQSFIQWEGDWVRSGSPRNQPSHWQTGHSHHLKSNVARYTQGKFHLVHVTNTSVTFSEKTKTKHLFGIGIVPSLGKMLTSFFVTKLPGEWTPNTSVHCTSLTLIKILNWSGKPFYYPKVLLNLFKMRWNSPYRVWVSTVVDVMTLFMVKPPIAMSTVSTVSRGKMVQVLLILSVTMVLPILADKVTALLLVPHASYSLVSKLQTVSQMSAIEVVPDKLFEQLNQ